MAIRNGGLVAFVALTLLSAGLRAPRAASQSENAKKPCCFKNPGYAGTCTVQPTEDETCASILAYLNNPVAEGKTYCGGTTIRRGWTEVSCDAEGAGLP
jgi:hypothetical protein